MTKLLKDIRICFIVFLAVVMAVGSPLAVYAETLNTYISAVSIGSKADLEAAGYTVVESDIRAASAFSGAYIAADRTEAMYLGYKTTMKRTEAITDIRALNMYGGYSKLDFDAIIESRMSDITETADYIMQAVLEFRTNYALGKRPAKIAYDTLNAFYVPETGQALGDYLLDTKIGTADITSLVLMASNAVLSYIINMLVLAVSDDVSMGEQTWAQRAVEIGPFNLEGYSQGKIEEFFSQNYDNEYYQGAYYVLSALEVFVDTYEEALKAYPGGVVTDLDEFDKKASESDTYAMDILSGDEEDDPRSRYAMAFAVMDELNSTDDEGYKYYYGANDDGTERSLGQYILEIVHTAETDEMSACRLIYPLLVEVNGQKVFTTGQEVVMSLSDFSTFFAMTASDNPDYDAAEEEYKNNVAELLALNNNEKISVFFGINTDVYTTDKDIYMTSKTARETAGNDRYSIITEASSFNDDLTQSEKLWNKVITASCWAIGALGGAIIGIVVVSKASAALAAGTAWVATCNACLTIGTVIGVVGIVMLVVAAIVLLVFFLEYEEAEDDESEAEKERNAFKWKDIPTYIYDYKKNKDTSEDFGKAIAYESVNLVGTDKPANLNSNKSISDCKSQSLDYGENQSWTVLYYTKNINAGSPLCLNSSSSSPFIVQYDDSSIPADYSSVRFFEEKSPGNVNIGELLGTSVYIMMHRLDNGSEDNAEKGKYISDVVLCTGTTEDGVIGEIMRKEDDYEVVYCNLTPDVDGLYTYIGYTTTDNEKYAIRDLRVAYAAASDKIGTTINYGGAEYVICGDVGELILCETRYECAGTPILAYQTCYMSGRWVQCCGVMATTTLGNVPEGYEPVNLFCGGPAFDFNGGGNWEALVTDNQGNIRIGVGNENSYDWNTHVYLYFNPETKFIEGEKYLGGLVFFSYPATDGSYIEETGWTIYDKRDLGGAQKGTITRLCYYETYNPYRAIYDIKSYKAELSATSVPYNIAYGSTGYTACDVYAQGGGGLGGLRTIRATHSYRSCYFLEGGGYSSFQDYVKVAINNSTALPSFNYVMNQSYEVTEVGGTKYYSKINCIGLYTTGKCSASLESETPIKLSDLSCTYTKPSVEDGESLYDYTTQTPVRDFRDAYSDYAANLGADDVNGNRDFYLFIARPDENYEVPKYISSVTVAYARGNSDGDNTPFDTAILSLVANGEGKLYEMNLSGNAVPWTCSTYSDSCTVDEHNIPSTSGRFGDDYWVYDFTYNVLSTDCVKNANVAYMWIQYTDVPTNALSDLIIYKTTSANAPEHLGYYYTSTQKKSTRTNRCGDGWVMDSEPGYYFYLYSVNHNGHIISDIDFSDTPMINGEWTSLGFDNKCVSMGDLYLHTTHVDDSYGSNKYITGIYSSVGTDSKSAQIDLLNQGCRLFVGYDINPSGQVQYLGYSVTLNYENAYSSFKLVESGQNDTITKAQYGWNIEYNYLTSSLNSAASSIIIKLFGTHSDIAAEINGGSGDDGHYIDNFMFSDTAQKNITTEQDGQTWRWSLVTDMDGNPQTLSMGFVDKGGSKKEFVESSYMYVHYTDNEFDEGDLFASVFVNSYGIYMVIAGLVIILAGVFIVLRTYKKRSKQG